MYGEFLRLLKVYWYKLFDFFFLVVREVFTLLFLRVFINKRRRGMGSNDRVIRSVEEYDL